MATNIIFVLGPAGVGKTHLSAALAKKLDHLFYEVDQYPAAGGIDAQGLRKEWNEFYNHATTDGLVAVLKQRAQAAGKGGVVLSFPSMLILKGDHLRVLRGNVRVVYLTGSEEQCRGSFLAREQKTGRGLDAEHWEQNNKVMFQFLGTEEAQQHVVAAFEKDGARRSVRCLPRWQVALGGEAGVCVPCQRRDCTAAT